MNPYLQTANSLSNSPFVVVVIINILAAKKHVKDSMVAGGGGGGCIYIVIWRVNRYNYAMYGQFFDALAVYIGFLYTHICRRAWLRDNAC